MSAAANATPCVFRNDGLDSAECRLDSASAIFCALDLAVDADVLEGVRQLMASTKTAFDAAYKRGTNMGWEEVSSSFAVAISVLGLLISSLGANHGDLDSLCGVMFLLEAGREAVSDYAGGLPMSEGAQ